MATTAKRVALVVGVAATMYIAWRRRRHRLSRLSAPPPAAARVHAAAPPLPAALSFIRDDASDADAARAVLLQEQLSRNTQFLGVDGQAKVARSHVAIVGLGAVGSHVATLLARTGVERLRLIDPALVSAACIQSHALAVASDIGVVSKAYATRRELQRTVPHCAIEVIADCALTDASAATLLDGVDVAVLAFPSGGQRCGGGGGEEGGSGEESGGGQGGESHGGVCELAVVIAACQRLGVRCLPVLYADASVPYAREVAHQRLSLLHDVCGCVQARALCAALRTLLPKQPHMPCGSLAVVHSGETACPSLRIAPTSSLITDGKLTDARLPPAASFNGCAAPSPPPPVACSRGPPLLPRAAVLAGMGHAAAAAVLAELVGSPLPLSSGVYSKSNRDEAHRALLRREREACNHRAEGGAASSSSSSSLSGGAIGAGGAAAAAGGGDEADAVDVWPEDLEYLVMDVWGGRCPLTGASIGSGGPSLVLTRWDRRKPAAVSNLVLLAKDRAEAHDKSEGDPREALPVALRRAIEATLRRAASERLAWAVRRA